MSPGATRVACRAELQYALDLGRPLLPVLVGDVDMNTVPPEVSEMNARPFNAEDRSSVFNLALALKAAPAVQSLPDPLPAAPPPPMTNVAHLTEWLQVPELSFRDQQTLLAELQGLLNGADTREVAVEHLELLRRRNDVVESVAIGIERIMATQTPRASRRSVADFPRLPSLRASIAAGACTPVLGPGLTDSLIGARRGLAKEWADEYLFPLAEYQIHDLPQVAQFVKVQNDVATLRLALSDYLREKLLRDYPDAVRKDLGFGHLDEMLTQAWEHRAALDAAGETVFAEPHTVLASLPLPLFITAQPSNLLAHALKEAGKEPVVEFCRWRKDKGTAWPESFLKSSEPYEPSIEKPMVFHLFGNLDFPDSLVLTEDDYFDYLINVTRDRKLIPPSVRTAPSRSALMFLGFGVEQWEFRVLLRSLVSPESGRQQYNHVAAQFDLAESVIRKQDAKRYLEKYFAQFNQMTIDICWSSVDAFLDTFAQSADSAA